MRETDRQRERTYTAAAVEIRDEKRRFYHQTVSDKESAS
jgi:hypothetical protein